MAATRLRSSDWHRSLQQVLDRKGSVDIAVATDPALDAEQGVNVLWRVRLLDLTEDELVVEQPLTLGEAALLEKGVELVVIFAIGQNRWMFKTQHLGLTEVTGSGGRAGFRLVRANRLAMPKSVERCQRRTNYRVSTLSLSLPNVDLWPLLDPKTVIIAERANELAFKQAVAQEQSGTSEFRLPDVGPKFQGTLMNLGGGGLGLSIGNECSQQLLHSKLFWLRLLLPPDRSVPICATAKLVHTHMTAQQDYYAGLAFDFTFNPSHQKFVIEQIGRYLADVQRQQMMRKAG